MTPGGQRIPFLDGHCPTGDIAVKKLADHSDGLGVADYLCLRITPQNLPQGSRMIRLHVVHHHIVQRTVVETIGQIFKKPLSHSIIHSIQQDRFLVQYQIRVIADTSWNGKHIFKKIQPSVGNSRK